MRTSKFIAAKGDLNRRQLDAFEADGCTCVLAGPGSGKTATLVLKVAKLLNEDIRPPRGVACLTYSVEAARELQKRLKELDIRGGERLFVGTVHSFCIAKILRPFRWLLSADLRHLASYEIATEEQLAEARQDALRKAGINEPESYWKSQIEAYRRLALIDPSQRDQFEDAIGRICGFYQANLRAIRRIDFDEVVLGSLDLIQRNEVVRRTLAAKYPWFVVDEYQDLGLALHRMVLTLMDSAGISLFAVGDPDQSVYGFQGARSEFLMELTARDDIRTVVLDLNYRSPQRIIDASLYVLKPEEQRGFKSANSDAQGGELWFYECAEGLSQQGLTVAAEIKKKISAGYKPGSIAVLGKRWVDLETIQEYLERESIPFKLLKGRSYKPTFLTMWVEDVVRWCAAGAKRTEIRFEDLFFAWRRIQADYKSVPLGTAILDERVSFFLRLEELRQPDSSLGAWIELADGVLNLSGLIANINSIPARFRHDIRELKLLIGAWKNGIVSETSISDFAGVREDKVVLQTLHGSKGLEFDVVFMVALEEGVIPGYKDNEREARRLFYVGLTRAKKEIHLLSSGFFQTMNGAQRRKGRSKFVEELWARSE